MSTGVNQSFSQEGHTRGKVKNKSEFNPLQQSQSLMWPFGKINCPLFVYMDVQKCPHNTNTQTCEPEIIFFIFLFLCLVINL